LSIIVPRHLPALFWAKAITVAVVPAGMPLNTSINLPQVITMAAIDGFT